MTLKENTHDTHITHGTQYPMGSSVERLKQYDELADAVGALVISKSEQVCP